MRLFWISIWHFNECLYRTFRKSALIGVAPLVLIPNHSALAQKLSNEALYHRCYSQLTGQSSLRSSHLIEVRSGKKDAIALCLSYLNGITLTTASTSDLSISILNQLHQVHRSWFKKGNVLDSEVNRDQHWGTLDVYDSNEPALHITRSLFADSSVAEVLSRPVSLEGIRSPLVSIRQNDRRISRFSDPSPNKDGNVFRRSVSLSATEPYFAPLIQVGRLTGIRDWTTSVTVPSLVVNPASSGVAEISPAEPPANFDLHKNYGGGVIGSIPYLIMNFGHSYQVSFNGTDKLPRRWGEAIVRDFLCRELPVLRNEDVGAYLVKVASVEFRKSTSCLQCHATVDNMALTARNLRLVGLNNFLTDTESKSFATIASYSVRSPASFPEWPAISDPSFHFQQPSGHLYFRSYSGSLISLPVSNIQSLGAAITQTKDYYVCFASRYFEYFTGIKVKLSDPGMNVISKDPLTTEYRDYVIDLGLELKSTGNLKKLISRILASDYYKQANFGFSYGGTP